MFDFLIYPLIFRTPPHNPGQHPRQDPGRGVGFNSSIKLIFFYLKQVMRPARICAQAAALVPCYALTFFFALLRRPYFYFRYNLPCCALFFFALRITCCAYPTVALSAFRLPLTLLCTNFFSCAVTLLSLLCCDRIFFVRNFFFGGEGTYPAECAYSVLGTLLCSYFSSRLPCCALIFLRTYPGDCGVVDEMSFVRALLMVCRSTEW